MCFYYHDYYVLLFTVTIILYFFISFRTIRGGDLRFIVEKHGLRRYNLGFAGRCALGSDFIRFASRQSLRLKLLKLAHV